MARKVRRRLSRFRHPRAVRVHEDAMLDSSFRALCDDYRAAAAALEFWSNAGDTRASRMIEEYREILGELGAEILAQIRGLK